MSKESVDALRVETERVIRARRKRLVRRQEAIRGDLARLQEAEDDARLAALAVPTLGRVARGSKTVAVVDYASGEPVTRSLAIDPAVTPKEALDKVFQRARRLRKGEPVARARLDETARAIDVLDAAIGAVAAAEDEEALEAARTSAGIGGPTRTAAMRAPQQRKPPYRTFRTKHGDVWVGRGAAKNDELTFHVAKPYHHWLHVRGTPGAHVVVPVARGHVIGPELLVDAAHLAVHFSDARGEHIVEVTHVQRKFVRKPRGSGPGAVTMEREKVLGLRVDDARLEHLLKCEVDQNE
jgi:predicted ribosome quality control (RQC) complex YloA/Tae2 family protein